jgi:hypothetical protein
MIFSLGRVVIGIKWAKSLLWFSKEQSNDIRTHFLSIGLIERAEDKALSIIILPLCITIGIINKEDV